MLNTSLVQILQVNDWVKINVFYFKITLINKMYLFTLNVPNSSAQFNFRIKLPVFWQMLQE